MKNDKQKSEIIIYQTETNEIKIDVRLEDDTVWLTQSQLVDLYQSSKANISEHIKNIFSDGELDKKVVVRKFRTTTLHGAIKGKTQNEYIRKGFSIDSDRLKNLGGGSDLFTSRFR